MSRNSITPLKHTDDPVHAELDKQKHITAHGGDVEAAGYEKENEPTDNVLGSEVAELTKTVEKLESKDPTVGRNEKAQQEIINLKTKIAQDERYDNYVKADIYNESELQIIADEIYYTPYVEDE